MQALPSRDFQFLTIPDAPTSADPLTLLNSSMWTYCGPLLPLSDDSDASSALPNSTPKTAHGLPPTFHAWSARTLGPSQSLLPQLLPFLRAAHAFLRARGVRHYWLTVRASQPTPDFDTPRWHTDDHFFDPPRSDDARGLWKLCATLQGPGTLFAADGARARRALRRAKDSARTAQREHVCSTVRCAACGRTSDAVREEVAVKLAGEKVVQPGSGEMVFFRLGGREGAVHSEPRIDRDRVFVNLVPGTEAELTRLMGRWGMGFPRSWSLGVPGMLDVEEPDREGNGDVMER